MNNLYNWHDERMVHYEMGEVNRAIEQARLLKEAGISGNDFVIRVGKVLGDLFVALKTWLQEQNLIKPRYQATDCQKYAG